MIPKTIHQIWIGPKSKPEEWMQTWHDKNPSMKYILWTEREIFDFGLRFKDKVEYLIGKGIYSGASDIIRIEILERLGGVYIDSDSICVKSIENAPFMNLDFFVGKDYDHKRKRFVNMVANGTIGSAPEHPILKEYLEKISKSGCTKWWDMGGRMLTTCITDSKYILPTCTFYPENWDGRKAPIEGETYAQQKWATTTGLY